nr:hypothetical protein [uncultured organism]
MKTNKQWAGALCMIAMAGCASDRMPSDTSSSNNGNSSGSSRGMSTNAAATPMTGSTPQASSAAQTSYGVVQAIDQMQRQDVGVGVVGAAAVGGSTGMATDKVYRVTVRMDDGNNQMVVVDSMPSYKIGDRVRYSNGTVVAY